MDVTTWIRPGIRFVAAAVVLASVFGSFPTVGAARYCPATDHPVTARLDRGLLAIDTGSLPVKLTIDEQDQSFRIDSANAGDPCGQIGHAPIGVIHTVRHQGIALEVELASPQTRLVVQSDGRLVLNARVEVADLDLNGNEVEVFADIVAQTVLIRADQRLVLTSQSAIHGKSERAVSIVMSAPRVDFSGTIRPGGARSAIQIGGQDIALRGEIALDGPPDWLDVAFGRSLIVGRRIADQPYLVLSRLPDMPLATMSVPEVSDELAFTGPGRVTLGR